MMKKGKQGFLTACVFFILYLPAMVLAVEDNPFDKGKSVNVGSDSEWLIKDKTATRSGSGGDDFYHLFFDRKQLRLRITDGAEDSEASAKKFQHLAIEDVKVDGKRLPVFQWCLGNQQKHTRFLEQGLKVKKGVCGNEGEVGTFTMRLNAATLGVLKNSQTLSFKIKPFRSSLNVNFDISDFSDMVVSLKPKKLPVKEQAFQAAVVEKVIVSEKCLANPPKDFAKIKSVEYLCNDAAAKKEAETSIAALVVKERKQAAEQERKRKQAAAAAAKAKAEKQAKALADKKAEEERIAAEQAALAEAEASKQLISADITNKMLAVCQKKWAVGEHRCYCEKFIEHAPEGISSDPSCAAQ